MSSTPPPIPLLPRQDPNTMLLTMHLLVYGSCAVSAARSFLGLTIISCGIGNVSVKYQFPNEDLDALISVTTDEDLENMMEEYDRLAQNQNPRLARLRLFLFSKGDDDSRASSISSLLNGSVNSENWFFDALNGGAGASRLERGRSEASSIVSEVPDYLFGLDNSDETQPPDPKLRTRQLMYENNSVSDPGSPAPVFSSSSFCSTSSVPIVPSVSKSDNPKPVLKSKQNQTDSFVEQPVSQPTTYSGNAPTWHYVHDSHYSVPAVQPIPVYYIPGHAQPGNPHAQVQQQPVQIRAQYVQQYPSSSGQTSVGYHQQVPGVGQAYGAASPVDPYDPTWRVGPDGATQQVYYGVTNTGPMGVYPRMVVPGGSDMTQVRNSQSGQ
ncbi:putative cyclin d [Hibiscus syriacus]|uniref:Cyclin d n=1 Tax=Hibiscus syriacus TaxID=106335 RepID=A0A6A2ZDV0_HIBSY|nr:putative cyclin d [Hibiscus syriacus]